MFQYSGFKEIKNIILFENMASSNQISAKLRPTAKSNSLKMAKLSYTPA